MPIVPLGSMIENARRERYGLCYCESWNLESLQAVIEAAEECRSPIIAGFNGGFLRHQSRSHPEKLAYYASLRLALETATVPVAFLLNESDNLAQIEEGVCLGFNAVMPESDGIELAAYEDMVRAVVALARPSGVWVEAQLGHLPTGRASLRNGDGRGTDPEEARRFAADTGIDALAVSVGNVHVLTRGKARIDLDALRRIRDRVNVPLVLHGGTSLTPECLRAAIEAGVVKFNFGTVLKQAYLTALRAALTPYRSHASPHEFLGMGGSQDIMVAARGAVQSKVAELLRLCGSAERTAHDLSTAT